MPAVHDHLIRVCYRDTDQMGMVYYANFLVFMEIGRVELLRAVGGNYKQMEADGHLIPVLEAHCEYKTPARYDDLLRVRTRVVNASRLRLEFAYEIFRDGEDAPLATGWTRHVFINREGKPTRAPGELVAKLMG